MRKSLLFLVALSLLVSCKGKASKEANTNEALPTIKNDTAAFVLGVVNTDSILTKYTFAIEARESMIKKMEESQRILRTRTEAFQREVIDFQTKQANNGFMSVKRKEEEEARLQRKGEELAKYKDSLEDKLIENQQKLSKQIEDSLSMAIKAINNPKRFAMIISTNSQNGNVLYADDALIVTDEVLEYLNSRLKK
jgi:hypothetical protein